MVRKPMSKKMVTDVIERRTNEKIPLVFHKFWGEGLQEAYGNDLSEMADNYPDDIFKAAHIPPGFEKSTNSNPAYRWGYKDDYSKAARHSIGQNVELLDNWDDFDKFISDFPSPYEEDIFANVKEEIKEAGSRYKLGYWWNLFHERFWTIRGMENLMMDYYDNMENLKRLGNLMNEYYRGIVDQYAELGFDGIFISDDLGHQTGPMMSPQVFRELYFPLYKEFIDYVHSKNMHVFLHSCGDNTLLMDDLIEAGLDVIHPIQAGCMDYQYIAQKYHNKITFLLGVDVQYLLPNSTSGEVTDGIKKMVSAFESKGCSVLLAAGNGIMPDTPLENIKVMLDTISLYK